MAKKAQATEPAPAAAGAPTSTLADAIRVALGKLGVDAGKDDVVDSIKRQHPTMQYKESTLNSSLSSIRKKLKGDTGASHSHGLTVKELLSVKSLAESQGGVDQLLAEIDKVEGLAKKVGGLSRLRGCLHSLKDLTK